MVGPGLGWSVLMSSFGWENRGKPLENDGTNRENLQKTDEHGGNYMEDNTKWWTNDGNCIYVEHMKTIENHFRQQGTVLEHWKQTQWTHIWKTMGHTWHINKNVNMDVERV